MQTDAEIRRLEGELPALRMGRDHSLPVPLHAVNQLSTGLKRRLYRVLIPPALLTRFGINPIAWENKADDLLVTLEADAGSHIARLTCRHAPDAVDPFFFLELSDNVFNGIDVDLLLLSDPDSPRYGVDRDEEGQNTLFGTVARNLPEEERAMAAGLAPAQVRGGLRAAREVLLGLDLFCLLLGHPAYYLEPLTYVAAWLFERHGCSYISGRRFMQAIDEAFRPGGALHATLDGSTPFRQPDQWRTVRGRAWAIHDGVLAAIGRSWNDVRMVRRAGYDAGIRTAPDAGY